MAPEIPTPEAPAEAGAVQQKQDAAASQNVPAAENPGVTAPTMGRSALRRLGRELDDADLANKGVQKMVLDRMDAAEAECSDLRKYVDRFHEVDKRAAVLESKLNTSTAFEVLCAGGFGGGGILIGFAPSILDKHWVGGVAAFIVGTVFILASIIARVVQVKK